MAAPEGYHHNAGVDARESIESVIAMLIAWPGSRKPADDWQMPVLVAVDLYAHQAALCKKTILTRLTVSVRLTLSLQVDAFRRSEYLCMILESCATTPMDQPLASGRITLSSRVVRTSIRQS